MSMNEERLEADWENITKEEFEALIVPIEDDLCSPEKFKITSVTIPKEKADRFKKLAIENGEKFREYSASLVSRCFKYFSFSDLDSEMIQKMKWAMLEKNELEQCFKNAKQEKEDNKNDTKVTIQIHQQQLNGIEILKESLKMSLSELVSAFVEIQSKEFDNVCKYIPGMRDLADKRLAGIPDTKIVWFEDKDGQVVIFEKDHYKAMLKRLGVEDPLKNIKQKW